MQHRIEAQFTLYMMPCPWQYCLHFSVLAFFLRRTKKKWFVLNITRIVFQGFFLRKKGFPLMFDWKFHEKKFPATQCGFLKRIQADGIIFKFML